MSGTRRLHPAQSWRRGALLLLACVQVVLAVVIALPVRPRPVEVLAVNGALAVAVALLCWWIADRGQPVLGRRARWTAVLLPLGAGGFLLWALLFTAAWNVHFIPAGGCIASPGLWSDSPPALMAVLAVYSLIAIGMWFEPATNLAAWQLPDGFAHPVVRVHSPDRRHATSRPQP
ncbi:MAG: hypothetical protein AB7K09_00920 [Planctomycetota bacterium]